MKNALEQIDLFLDSLWVESGLSENTLAAYGSDLKIFAKWLKNKSLFEVAESDIASFMENRYKQGIGSRSSARVLSSLKRFFGYLQREGSIEIDPTLLIEAPRVGRVLPESLSEQLSSFPYSSLVKECNAPSLPKSITSAVI